MGRCRILLRYLVDFVEDLGELSVNCDGDNFSETPAESSLRCDVCRHTLVKKPPSIGCSHDDVKSEIREHAFLKWQLYNLHSTREQDV